MHQYIMESAVNFFFLEGGWVCAMVLVLIMHYTFNSMTSQ